MLQRSSQFLQILSAEKDGLVECRLVLPSRASDRFMEQLKEVYISEAETSVAEAWNALRTSVLDAVVNEQLMPAAEQWAKTWLQEEEERYVGEICSLRLYQVSSDRLSLSSHCLT